MIRSYVEIFGAKNREEVLRLLNKHWNKLDPDPQPYIHPKIEKLKST